MTFRAVDCQSFAGGFTYGVAQAGFEIAGKREMKGGFGVPCVEANRHLLPGDWHTEICPPEAWSDPGNVSFVFGNPPCSAFSIVGKRQYTDDPILHCMTSFVEYAGRTDAPIMAFESVQPAYYKGLDFMRNLHRMLERRTDAEWTLHHVLDDGYVLDGPARRKRYFWVASRIPFGVSYPLTEPTHTLRDVIGDLEGIDAAQPHDQPYSPDAHVSDWVKRQNIRREDGLVDGHTRWWSSDQRYAEELLELGFDWPQGTYQNQHAYKIVEAYGTARQFMPRRHYATVQNGDQFSGNSEFETKRWRYDKPCRVVAGLTGRRTLHPVEPRMLTLRELFRAQGFSDHWRLSKVLDEVSPASVFQWPGKGIPVQAGRWLADHVMTALEGNPTRNVGEGVQTGEREWVWNHLDVPPARSETSKIEASADETVLWETRVREAVHSRR